MENLLRTALPRHYGISRNIISKFRGALLHQAVIESLGFEYRRISYEHSYAL